MEQAELVIDSKAILGEGAFWDIQKGLLYWLDFLNKSIHVYNPTDNKDSIIIKLDRYPASVIPRKSGGLLISMDNCLYFLDTEANKLTYAVSIDKDIINNRFNDGKCDMSGRFWSGTMNDYGKQKMGSIYCIDTDLKAKRAFEGITISNGIAWSPDNTKMYFVETSTREVYSFDFDINAANLSNKSIAIKIPENTGVPDGIAIDTEGMIWIALWGGWGVARYNPYTGKLVETIYVPVPGVTSCSFGGDCLNELFITTSSHRLSEKERSNAPYAGGIFRYKTRVKGLAFNYFKG